MSYTVLMIRVPKKGHPVPAYELKKTFETRETAVAAATRELALRGYEPSSGFQVFDAEGELVLAVPLGAAQAATGPVRHRRGRAA
jgi:hypothetical protein